MTTMTLYDREDHHDHCQDHHDYDQERYHHGPKPPLARSAPPSPPPQSPPHCEYSFGSAPGGSAPGPEMRRPPPPDARKVVAAAPPPPTGPPADPCPRPPPRPPAPERAAARSVRPGGRVTAGVVMRICACGRAAPAERMLL